MSHHRNRSRWFDLCWLIGVLAGTSSVPGQESETWLTKTRQRFTVAAERFRFSGGPGGDDAFEFLSRPALNWSNPERRTAAGAMFLWTLEGRPQAAMCMYPSGVQQFDLEFQSLSTLPFRATAEGQNVWEPAKGGIEFRQIEQAAKPAASLPVRLRQMRALAREFTSKLVPPKRTEIPLRLLSAPIYRYPTSGVSDEVVDGAVFAFVQGTDPEVLLMIEGIQDDQQQGRWQYGLARMSTVPTQVYHQGNLVWETNWPATRQRDAPYFVLTEYASEQGASN